MNALSNNPSGVLDVMKEGGKKIGSKFVTVGGIIFAVVTAPGSADAAELPRDLVDWIDVDVGGDWIDVDEDGNLTDDGNIPIPSTGSFFDYIFDPFPNTGP